VLGAKEGIPLVLRELAVACEIALWSKQPTLSAAAIPFRSASARGMLGGRVR